MHALERVTEVTVPQRWPVVRCDNVDILGADNNIDRLVLFKAEVHALEFAAEEFDQSVLKHNTVEDIAPADEVGNKCVLRLVINILGRADLRMRPLSMTTTVSDMESASS